MRAILAATLLGTVLVTPLVTPAGAALSCASVTDPTSDATAVAEGVTTSQSDSAMDIEKISVATDATRVTVVLKVYGLTQVDTMAPTGRLFDVDFTVRGTKKHLRVVIDETGKTYADPDATYTVDTAKAYEIHITMALSKLGLSGLRSYNARAKSKLKPDVFLELGATTKRWRGDLKSGQPVVDFPVDSAKGAIAYAHKMPSSCVKVGQ